VLVEAACWACDRDGLFLATDEAAALDVVAVFI
jgi:hypothetical protein